MPMAIETVAAVMACSKLGAIWVPIFSGFGSEAVAARLADAQATVLITADGSLRRGQPVAMKAIADRAADEAGCVEHILVWNRLDGSRHALERRARDVRWDELLAAQPARFDTRALDSEHPLFIGYTSGTTGRPKGVLHVHGGFLVKIAEEVAYQVDLHRGEVLHWVTDLGWIMGPWEIVGALALGSTVLLTEGAPNHPRPRPAVGDGRTPRRHDARRVAHADPRAHPVAARAGPRARPLERSGSSRRPASRGTPSRTGGCSRRSAAAGCPIINLSGGTEVGRVLPLAAPDHAS